MAWVATVTSSGLVEASDRWVLPLAGKSVSQCCIDYSVTLRFEGGFEIRIEAPFVFRSAGQEEQLLVPEGDPVRMAPLLGVARGRVAGAAAFKDGHLELTFSGGSNISVAAAEDHEPWEIAGNDGLRIVSVPGGELAVWMPTGD